VLSLRKQLLADPGGETDADGRQPLVKNQRRISKQR